MTEPDLEGLRKLRAAFPPEQIGKLPKKTKTGGTVYLDFIGHGYITARLLDVDPLWNWQPFALGDDGLPAFDAYGGLWIRLTVCGMTRIGYGDADGERGPNAIKEAIGDALRNAGMRFGAALALWCGGDLIDPAEADAMDARTELRAYCTTNSIDLHVVAEAFLAEHHQPLNAAPAEQVRKFKAQLAAELERPEPAPAAPADADPQVGNALPTSSDDEPAEQTAMQYRSDGDD